jgi:hypothetical protein
MNSAMPSSTPGSAFRYLVLSSAFSHSAASTAASISASRATVVASVRQGKCGSGSSCAMGASARRSSMRVRPISSGAPSGQSKRSPLAWRLRCSRAPLRVCCTSTLTVRGASAARSMRRCVGATCGSSSTRSHSRLRPTVTGQRVTGARASSAPWRSKASSRARVGIMARPPTGRTAESARPASGRCQSQCRARPGGPARPAWAG